MIFSRTRSYRLKIIKMNEPEKVLNEIISLFPDDIQADAIRENYPLYLEIIKTVLACPDIAKTGTVLDIGAGSGIVPLVLQKMGYSAYAVDTWTEYGEDFSNRMGVNKDIIERLKANNVRPEICNIEESRLPYDDSFFDAVLFLDVLEHLHGSPKKTLAEINRVLRPGGTVVITTPNLATLKNRLFMLAGRSVYTDLDYWYNSRQFFGHVREYTRGEVRKMLGVQGFAAKAIRLSNTRQTAILKNSRFGLYSVALALYIFIAALVPAFRYEMIIIGTKVHSAPD